MKRFSMLLLLPAAVLGIPDMKWFDLNNWRCLFYNDGRWRVDVARVHPGAYWPYPEKNYYILGAGVWLGTIQGNDTLTTIGYNPNTTETELTPRSAVYGGRTTHWTGFIRILVTGLHPLRGFRWHRKPRFRRWTSGPVSVIPTPGCTTHRAHR